MKKGGLLLTILIVFLLLGLSNISAFCRISGEIFDSTNTLTQADSVNVTCIGSSSNTTGVPSGLPSSGYLVSFGGVFENCAALCGNGGYVNASNSTLGLWGQNSTNDCGTEQDCTINVSIFGAAGPTVTIVTPTSDYTYTTGTTNYDATCSVGGGSVSEVIFTSNHSGANTNYSFNGAELTNPSGNTYRYAMPSLSAGTYLVYEWFCNQTSDGQSDTDGPQEITVNQAAGEVYTRLNGSRSNITTDLGTYINLSAELNTGIGSISLYNNGTLINQGTGVIYNNTLFSSAGTYNITAFYDGNTNYSSNFETWYVIVSADNNPPYFTTIPANASINYGQSLNVDFDAVDGEGNFDSFGINDSRFNIGASTGTLTNASELAGGTYIIDVTINDTSGNYNSTLYQVTVNPSSSSCDVLFNETSPVTYPSSFIVYSNCDSSFTLYRNGSVISNNSEQTLGAGTYNFTVIRDDNSNYSNFYDEETFVVSKATPVLAYYLNGLTSNAVVTYPNTINASASTNAGTLVIYRNDTDVTSENNVDIILAANYYRYDFNVTGNENYSDVSNTLYATVNQAAGEVYCYLNNSRSNLTIELGTYADLNATINVPSNGNVKLYNNGTLINQGSDSISNVSQFSSFGYFNITAIYNGNENYTSDFETWYVIVNDTEAPQFTDIANISVYDNESVYYDINATDASPICFSVNDTDFTIDCDGILQNATTLSLGFHWLTITVNDSFGNENSSVIYVNVSEYPDNNPPYFTTIPANASLTYGQSLNVDFDAVDAEGNFDSFSINDSRFNIDSNGGLTNITSLGAGVYIINVSINDTSGNYNSTLYQVTVNQATPSLSITITPSNSETYGTQTTASVSGCPSEITCTLYRNDTGVISAPDIATLGVGVYEYTYNTSGNANYTSASDFETLTININTSLCDVLFNETSPVTYPSSFIVYSNCDSSFTLYRNGSVIANNSVQDLGAGVYNFTVNRADSANYTNTYDEENFVVQQGTGVVYTYLNASRGNFSTLNNTYVNLSAELITGSGEIKLYNNGTLINQGIGLIYNNTLFDSLGIYNITSLYDGNANYTVASETWFVNVTEQPDTIDPNITFVNITTATGNYSQDYIEANVSSSDNSGVSLVEIYLYNTTGLVDSQASGLENYSYNFTSLDDGTYYLNASVNDTSDNQAFTETRTILLDTTAPYFSVFENQTVYNNASLNYDIDAIDDGVGVECFDINDTVNFSITCDGVLTNLSELVIDDIHILNVSVNDTLGNLNYSDLIINITVSVCGNSIVEASEQCDDGNNASGDGCSASCQNEDTGGGGGGGGGPTPEPTPVDPFDVDPNNLVVNLVQGERETELITIENNLDERLSIVVDYGSFAEFVDVDNAVFTLDAGESKEIEVEIRTDIDTLPDSYVGTITVKGDDDEEDVGVVVNVEARPEEALFDIFTKMITKRVRPGTNARARIDLTNIGNIDATDVSLYYAILDFENNTIVSEEERLSIGRTLKVRRELPLPVTETDPSYVFYARVNYPGGTATSADTFITSPLPNWLLFLITILIIIASVITTLIIHRRNVTLVGPGV